MNSQKSRILAYIRANGSITQAEAFLQLGCSRLSARIWDLHHDGHNIKRTMRKTTNRYGDKTEIATYTLEE